MTTRRGFLGAILVAAAAPAIIRSEILMPVRKMILPPDPAMEVRRVGDVTITPPAGMRVGDVITISGITQLAGGALRQFVVTKTTGGVILGLTAAEPSITFAATS